MTCDGVIVNIAPIRIAAKPILPAAIFRHAIHPESEMMRQRPRLHLAAHTGVEAQPPKGDGHLLHLRLEIPLIVDQPRIIRLIAGIPVLVVVAGMEERLPVLGQLMLDSERENIVVIAVT